MNRVSSSNFPLDVNVNVDIKVLNGKGKICNHVQQHNKATVNMTSGIIKFLRGEFNETNLSINSVGHDFDSAKNYIPNFIGIGNIGTAVDGGDFGLSGVPIYAESYYANYADQKLKHEIFKPTNIKKTTDANGNEVDIPEIHRIEVSRSTCGDSPLSDTFSLKLSSTINFSKNFRFYDINGLEVHKIGSDSKYWLPGYEKRDNSIVITEIGLFSGDVDDSGSKLLARMLLDSSTPIIIDSTSTVIINWIIGVCSIDDTMLRKPNQEYNYFEKEQNFTDITWDTE